MIPSLVQQNILFITSTRIGDAVLSTGILNHLYSQYPDAQYTICCGPLVTSLFEGFPAKKNIIALQKQKYHGHWFDLWCQIKGIKFDIVVDLRNSIVSRFVRSRKRYIFGRTIDRSQHKVLQNAAVIDISHAPPDPTIWVSQTQKKYAEELMPPGGLILGVGPTANWVGKTWPIERFKEVVAWVRSKEGVMPHARVAVFAAPGEEDDAHLLLNSIPTKHRIDVIAKTDPGTAAAALARCDYYIGNDSGLMHCAAAADVPTLGLFGPSYPHLYAPWGDHCRFVRTPESFDELIGYDGYDSQTCGCLMESLSTVSVKKAIKKMAII